jgi:hypothetical protein
VGALMLTACKAVHVQPAHVLGAADCMQELGIPTANVDADALRGSLAEAVTGIYCGWASIGSSGQVRASLSGLTETLGHPALLMTKADQWGVCRGDSSESSPPLVPGDTEPAANAKTYAAPRNLMSDAAADSCIVFPIPNSIL